MRLSRLLLLLPALAGPGCSSMLPLSPADRGAEGPAAAQRPFSIPGNIARLEAGRDRPWLESWRIADRTAADGAGKLSDHQPAADAVIPMPADNAGLGLEAERRLAGIARLMREDGRILLRLESHVPQSGSSALNLGIAERALQQVKARLVDLRVSPRRILASPSGERRPAPPGFQSGWVELHLVRPSYSARND